jgi:hypothetical protein
MSDVEAFEARVKVHTAIGQILSSTVLLFGFLITWYQQAETIRKGFEAEAATRRIELADRYNKALQLLGSETPTLRLSAVHNLRQLATEDPSNYRATAIATLNTFVKEQATKKKQAKAIESGELWPPIDVVGTIENLSLLLEDINKGLPTEKAGTVRDLTNLPILNFEDCGLKGVRLERLFLARSNFSNADLSNANLRYCMLQQCDLSHAILRNSSMIASNLSESKLSDSDLSEARLTAARLTKADVKGTKMLAQEGTLSESQLTECFGDARTELPTNLARPGTWLK